jgi:hypothetical protein
VRVLASQDGVTCFAAQPSYAEDPLLRDTFEKQRPLLSAEAGLNKLTRYLSLTKLDDEVKTSALPFGEHHDSVYDDVAKRITGIKPYLLALVRAENSSAENWVRPALRNLALVVCEQLVLNYEYDGTGSSGGRGVLHREPSGEARPKDVQRRDRLPRTGLVDWRASLVPARPTTGAVPECAEPVRCLHHAAHRHPGDRNA